MSSNLTSEQKKVMVAMDNLKDNNLVYGFKVNKSIANSNAMKFVWEA